MNLQFDLGGAHSPLRSVARLVAVSAVFLAALILPASALAISNPFSFSSSAEGAITIANGDFVAAGYQFTIPGSHPDTKVLVENATVTITGPCSNGGTDTLVIPLAAGANGAAYDVPAGASGFYPDPSGNEASPSKYQGSVVANVCGGTGTLNASAGAVFSGTLLANPTTSTINIQFHYRDPNAKGAGNINCMTATNATAAQCGASWSSTQTVQPAAFAPAFTIQKSQAIAPSTAYTTSTLNGSVGQTVDYRILVTNSGNTDETFSAFTDANCDSGTIAGGPTGTLAPGASATYTCRHVLTSADATAGSYSNNATVTGTPPSGAGSASTQTSNTVVVNVASTPAPSFTIQKSQAIAPSTTYTTSTLSGMPGQTVDYQIVVTNTGNVSETFSAFTDSHCDAGTIAGGPSGPVAPGASTTYTCNHVLNSADQTAGSYSNTATVTGTPPSGSGSPMTQTSNTVVVNLPAPAPAPAPAFTLQKQQQVAGTSGPPVPNNNDQITVVKQQQFIGLAPGQTVTSTVTCPSGYLVLDGSPLVQQVDQGFGTPASIQVLQSMSSSPTAYTFTLYNPTGGSAQAQAFVTCVKTPTSGGGTITTSGPQTATVPFGVGTTTQTLTCAVGQIAVAPGYQFTSGQGVVTASQPSSSGLSGWTFTITGTQPGSVQLSIRCLDTTTSNGGLLVTQPLTQQANVPAGQTVTVSVTCPTGYKGIVAGYQLAPGVTLLGDEPQPITRVFTLQNTGTTDQTVTLNLICLMDTTASPGTQMPFTAQPVNASPGQVINYQITATNTGNTPLTFGPLSDPHCDSGTLTGGPGTTAVAPGGTTVWTCSHLVTSTDQTNGSYSNTATATGTPPSGSGSAITQSSNTVVANVGAAPRMVTALAIPAIQEGHRVAAAFRVAARFSTSTLRAYSGKVLVAIASVHRKQAGNVTMSVHLNRVGNRLLAHHAALRLRVVLQVVARGRHSQTIRRLVSLHR